MDTTTTMKKVPFITLTEIGAVRLASIYAILERADVKERQKAFDFMLKSGDVTKDQLTVATDVYQANQSLLHKLRNNVSNGEYKKLVKLYGEEVVRFLNDVVHQY